MRARLGRRRAMAGGLAFLVVGLPFWMPAAEAGDPEPGLGTAFGQGFKVDPKAGGLSIGIAFGQSTATHQNSVGRAVSTSMNLGVVGLTLGAQQCDGSAPTWSKEDQPLPLIVDSRDEGAEEWQTATDDFKRGGSGSPESPFVRSARATTDPYGEAVTIVNGRGNDNDPSKAQFQMGTSIVRAYSGLVDGVREARATVDLNFLKLGPLFISELRWDALHRSTGEKKTEGTFTFGTFTFGGTTTRGSDDDQTTQLGRLNEILKNLGVKLVPGQVHESKDTITVDPLAIVVQPNETRDTPAKTVFGNAEYQKQRKALTDAILGFRFPAEDNPDTPENETRANGCRAGTYISVADIVVGSVTGAGEFVLSFGGAMASTGVAPKNNFTLDLPPPLTTPDLFIPGTPPTQTTLLPTAPIVDGPRIPTALPDIPGTGQPPTGPRTRLITTAGSDRGPAPSPFEGERAGALATVGLVTLAVLALLAEGDRRTMRNMLARQAATTSEAGR